MAKRPRIPKFRSEQEEAEWWDTHPEVIAVLFAEAKAKGQLKTLPSTREPTRKITIRLAVNDVETARELAEQRGLPYQTYIKMLLHQALAEERQAS